MEYLWSTYGIPMEQHARNTPAAGWVLAERAGAERREPVELPALKRSPKLARSGGWAEGTGARQEGGSGGEGDGLSVSQGVGEHPRPILLG